MQPGKVCGWLHICLLQSSRQHGWEQNPSSCCSSPFNHRNWDLVNISLQTAPAWMPEAHQLQSGWILNILFPEKTSATSALCLLPNLVHGLPLHACYQFGVSPNTKQGWLGVWWCWGNAWVSSGGLLGIVMDSRRKNWHVTLSPKAEMGCQQRTHGMNTNHKWSTRVRKRNQSLDLVEFISGQRKSKKPKAVLHNTSHRWSW